MMFMKPEIEIVRFSSEDVIATSGLVLTNGVFYIPSANYNNGALGGSGYVQFSGSYGAFNSAAGGYLISNISGAKLDYVDDRAGLMSGGSYYFPDVGVTVDMSDLAPIAQQAYDAYSYNGDYYTNGVSYYNTYWTN